MIYHNPTGRPLSFEVAGDRYDVPPGGECDISPRLAFVVEARGLPLVQGSQGGTRVEATIAPVIEPQLPPGVETGAEGSPQPRATQARSRQSKGKRA